MTRRRKKFTPPRCKTCRAPIRWCSYANDWRMFDPTPIRNPRTHVGPPAYVIENRTAWRLDRMVAELMGRRECTETEARDEAYDMTWHHIHACTTPAPAGEKGSNT